MLCSVAVLEENVLPCLLNRTPQVCVLRLPLKLEKFLAGTLRRIGSLLALISGTLRLAIPGKGLRCSSGCKLHGYAGFSSASPLALLLLAGGRMAPAGMDQSTCSYPAH